jgi:hypothetical protein
MRRRVNERGSNVVSPSNLEVAWRCGFANEVMLTFTLSLHRKSFQYHE